MGVAEKLHVVVHDNDSNFVAGLQSGNVPNIPCLAHTLQLGVKDGCLAQPCEWSYCTGSKVSRSLQTLKSGL